MSIDLITEIQAQPRVFAEKMQRLERERAELIETVSRLRAELAQAQSEIARLEMIGNGMTVLASQVEQNVSKGLTP